MKILLKAKVKKLMEIVDKNSPLINICICHVPLFKPKDLIPYNIFLYEHIYDAQMIKSRVLNGLYNYLNKYYVYCASGVGTSEPPMRVVSRANIGLIILLKIIDIYFFLLLKLIIFIVFY